MITKQPDIEPATGHPPASLSSAKPLSPAGLREMPLSTVEPRHLLVILLSVVAAA